MTEEEVLGLNPGDEIKLGGINVDLVAKVVAVRLVEERHVVVFEIAGTQGVCTPGFITTVVKRAPPKPTWYDETMN